MTLLTEKKLNKQFFNKSPQHVAQALLGKVLCHRTADGLLSAQIIETEAYCLEDKASHASLGFTEKRKALFMPAGTIYMYYARGGDSLNFSCRGQGNAVLIKSAIAQPISCSSKEMISVMQKNNPIKHSGKIRSPEKLCSGQTLLCQALDLRVPTWDGCQFNDEFFIVEHGYQPQQIVQTTRLGIPAGRDEDLLYRFIDHRYLKQCTKNPLTCRQPPPYRILTMPKVS